jgi:crotonobetainyl-CoA:carnitine CoA-transferase CaiB-like acyl-CoA transferase
VLDAPEWIEDARFLTNTHRMQNLDALVALMNEKLAARTVAEWIALLEPAGVPCGPINSIAQVLEDPHALARDMVVELEHPKAGRTRAIGLPIKLSATPGKVVRPAPLFGQHTREVLAEFGFGAAEIEDLIRSGAAVAA